MTNVAEKKSLPFTTIMALQETLEDRGGLDRAQSAVAVRHIEASDEVQKTLYFGEPDPRDVPHAIRMAAYSIPDARIREASIDALAGNDVNLLLMGSVSAMSGGKPNGMALLMLKMLDAQKPGR